MRKNQLPRILAETKLFYSKVFGVERRVVLFL
jgi:hypothetical protein